MSRSWLALLLIMALLAPLTAQPPYVRAEGGALTVTQCDADGLAAALAQADAVTFACGPDPVTINPGELTIATGRSVTIDGADRITLSGSEANRLFAVEAGATLTLVGLRLVAGTAPSGGAILNRGTLRLLEMSVTGNQAIADDGVGGAIANFGGSVQISASELRGNLAPAQGGAIYSRDGALIIETSSLEANQARDGGAIASLGSLTIQSTTLHANVAINGAGGGVAMLGGGATITASSLTENVAFQGGGLFIGGDPPAEVSLSTSLFEANQASFFRLNGAGGGGIYNEGRLLIAQTTLAGNRGRLGGGVAHFGPEGQVQIVDSTLYANGAELGGGLWISAGRDHTLLNTTLSGNEASLAGGGLYHSTASTSLRHLSLVNNLAQRGANLAAPSGEVLVQALLLAAPRTGGNCSFEDFSSPLQSQGANLADDGSCAFAGLADRNFADLVPGDLREHGGPTLTHLPNVSSPALDAAPITGCPATDQRGLPRPAGRQCDSGATEIGATPAPDAPALQPFAPPGAPRPSLSLSPNRGSAGQTIIAAGQAPLGAGGILIATVLNGRTIVGAEAQLGADRSYRAELIIPPDLAPGPVQICVLPRGLAGAALTCATLTVEPMPGAQVQVSSALLAGSAAQLQLFGPDQTLAYSVPINQSGAAQLNNLAPGVYRYAVSGQLSQPVAGGVIALRPGVATDLSSLLRASQLCVQAPAVWVSSEVGVRPPDVPSRPSPYAGARVIGPALTTNKTVLNLVDQILRERLAQDRFGTYINGVQTMVTFQAHPQTSRPAERVIFRFFDPEGRPILGSERPVPPPFVLPFDVGTLPARSSPTQMSSMTVTPVVDGKEVNCAPRFPIDVLPNPIKRPGVQPDPYSDIRFNPVARQYEFKLSLIHVPGALPWSYATPDLPIFGVLNNRLNLAIQTKGVIDLEGRTTINSFESINEVYLLNNRLLGPNGRDPLTVVAKNANSTCVSQPLSFGPERWDQQQFLVQFANVGGKVGLEPKKPIPLFPLPSLLGVVFARIGGSNEAGVLIAGCVAPFRPAAAMVIEPYFEKQRTQGLDVHLLAGASRIAAELFSRERVSIVLSTNLIGNQPGLNTPDLCLQLYYEVRAWIKPPLLPTLSETIPLPVVDQCLTDLAAPAATSPPALGELLAEPIVATAADGQAMVAFVEQAPGTERSQIVVRLRTAAGVWGSPVTLSSTERAASSPALAFVGAGNLPLAVWVENTLSANEAAALGDDLAAMLNHQELFFSLWRDGAWSTPTRLTDDALADGLPTLAGHANSALLAWVRDGDGDAATRADQQIAVRLFNPTTAQFGALTLLNGGAGLNGDVAAAYGPSGTPYLVWVHDADADLQTADDRRMVVRGRPETSWLPINTSSLPAGVDSPTISAGPEGLRLAFLVRDPEEDGTTPILGTNGVVWTARSVFTSLDANPLRAADGSLIYGERPVLARQGDESLLLLRQFGQDADAAPGQLALAQANTGLNFGAPLPLSNDTREQWQGSLAIDPLTRQALIVQMTRGEATTVATQLLGSGPMALSAAASPPELITFEATADPALLELTASPTLPQAGTLVQVQAQVRNLGRNPSNALVVSLYRGTPGSSTLVAARPLAEALAFGASETVLFTVESDGSELPLYAEVTGAANQNPANDQASVLIGRPSAPTISAAGLALDGVAVSLSWQPAPAEFPLGYQVLRSASPNGSFELIGASANTDFVDAQAVAGSQNCYAVQAYSASVLGPVSAPVCVAAATQQLFLPLIRR
ncbi:MAG: choice-of-anchor Q domain-containing protein [Oscillochloridaceae bacterium umkhey_bin13]